MCALVDSVENKRGREGGKEGGREYEYVLTLCSTHFLPIVIGLQQANKKLFCNALHHAFSLETGFILNFPALKECHAVDNMNWRRKQTAHYWDADYYWPAKWKGVKTLHQVTDKRECRCLLQKVSKSQRVEYLLQKDWFHWTALHVMALTKRKCVAEMVLKSLDSQKDRDKVITSGMKNGGEIPLHWACSVDMVRLLLDTLSPNLIQNCLGYLDGNKRSAAHFAVIDQRPDIFKELWSRSTRNTREKLILNKDSMGRTLLMYAAHANDVDTINLILDHSKESEYYQQLFLICHPTAINSIILPLIVHQRFSLIADVLHRITVNQRRSLLSIENNKGISALKLATLPTALIRDNIPKLVGFFDYFRLYKNFGNIDHKVDMHSYLRHFTYEMCLTSQASIVELNLQAAVLRSSPHQFAAPDEVSYFQYNPMVL